jgi:formylglycine-generating enzyme required for sulfatase activity
VARLALALVVATASVAGPHGQVAESPANAVTNSLGMRMVRVASGSFLMGTPPGEPLRQDEEIPRRVTLTRAFRIAATEVTQGQWLALMPRSRPQSGEDRPVTSVSWKEAQEFCLELSKKEGKAYRLPTEAEWEYACRAGRASPPVAGVELAAVAWYADDSEGTTHPVGLKEPNAWGLHDMLGNVSEWTMDVYGPYPRGEGVEDPTGPATGSSRVVRGGSWRSFPPALRCAARVGTPESYQLPHVGLRVVQEVE